MKIAIYGTCQNEQPNVDQWLATTALADYRVMCDTGSQDLTVAWFNAGFREPKDALYHISIEPFRSDDSRNAAMALIPADADVCINLDLDETLQLGWREAIEAAWAAERPCRAEYWYIWNHKADGSPDVKFLTNNRVHSRDGYRFKHIAHEGLQLNMHRTETIVPIPDLTIEQFQVPKPARPRDTKSLLEQLAWAQWEDPDSTRMLHYYGRELMWNGYHLEAIGMFGRYLELEPRRPFPEERAVVAGYLVECQQALRKAA